MNEVPFHYPPSGNVIVCGDGPELLVYSGGDDTALWKEFCENILVGVGAWDRWVVSLDADGLLRTYRALDGSSEAEFQLDYRPKGLDLAPDGTAAILVENGVVVMRPGDDSIHFSMPGASYVSFGRDSSIIGVGTSSGAFYSVNARTGIATGVCELGKPIAGLCWRHPQSWAVAAGNILHQISGDGTSIEHRFAVEGEAGHVACTSDGSLISVVLDKKNVAVFETNTRFQVGTVETDQIIGGMDFGPEVWLAIGLDGGDANRMDLYTSKLNRTESHPGRGQNRWLCKIQFDSMRIRGSVATLRAGGRPIAMRVDPEVKEQQQRRSWVSILLAVLALLFVCGLCTGCMGTIGLYLGTLG